MKINLHPPIGIHDQGRRENNEDYIYPSYDPKVNLIATRLFLVCDGVGGSEKGEVASKMVCETLWDLLHSKATVTPADINYAVKIAEQRIDEYIVTHREASGMATTLTMLAFHAEGATIAHIGDSRVYQIRNGKIIFKTADHSLVNDLIEKGIITEQEALNHPRRNVITKAISGHKDHQVADIKAITDVQPGDYFFLCSDGITESFSDNALIDVFNAKTSNEDKIAVINSTCKNYSKDNFSAYLVQVKAVKKDSAIAAPLVFKKGKAINKNILFTLLAVISGIAIAFLFNSNSNKKKEILQQVEIESSLDILNTIDTKEIDINSEDLSTQEDSTAHSDSIVVDIPPKQHLDLIPKKTIAKKKKSTKKKPTKKQDPISTEIGDSYLFEEALELSITQEQQRRKNFTLQELDNIDPDPLKAGDISKIIPPIIDSTQKMDKKN